MFKVKTSVFSENCPLPPTYDVDLALQSACSRPRAGDLHGSHLGPQSRFGIVHLGQVCAITIFQNSTT